MTVLVAAGLAALAAFAPSRQPAVAAANRLTVPQIKALYSRLPLSFEPNLGQTDPRVAFLSRGPGYQLFLTRQGAVLELPSRALKLGSQTAGVVRLQLVGANPRAALSGIDELPGKSNYLVGNDPSAWRANVPHYARARYRDAYPGVDLIYYGRQGQLEYDFVVAPGADPSQIGFDVGALLAAPRATSPSGKRAQQAAPLRVDGNGDLVVTIASGEVRFRKPVVYQVERTAGLESRVPVEGHYKLNSRNRVSFELGPYDRARSLVIDPALAYSTYLGGGGADGATAIAVDSSGNAYLTGSTQSLSFPTATPLQAKIGGQSDAFVTKLSPTGASLIYSTYLGGNAADLGNGIAVDSSGNVYVAGSTSSANFPTTSGAFQTTYGGAGDAFIAKLNTAGSALVYSTFLGGSGTDFGQAVAIDASGAAFVTGSTVSTNFPTASPLQSALSGGFDAFVAELNPGGSALTYSTYLGGAANDSGQSIAVDAAGHAFVTGYTLSTNFPSAAAFQRASGGASDAFVSKLSAGGSALVYSTYLGGSGADRGFGIALDSAGAAYVTGDTASTNFPVTSGAFQTVNAGNGDAFVTKLNAAGSLAYSTFLGGGDADSGFGIAVDSSLRAYVTGMTRSADFPVVAALQPALGGGACGVAPCPDAFVAQVNAAGTALNYSTYLGGNGFDSGNAIAVDAGGSAYVAGATASTNFPAVSPAFQAVNAGLSGLTNAFVAKVTATDQAAFAVSPQTLTFASQGTGSTSAAQVVTVSDGGSSPLVLTSFTASAGFAAASAGTTCVAGQSLDAGASCAVAVTFRPTTTGMASGTLTFTDNAPGTPHKVALNGTGATPAPAVALLDQTGAVVTSLTFANEVVGGHSPVQNVTLENTGSAALSITKIAATGDYGESNNCGMTLAAGATCVISVTFVPTGSGARAGTLTVTDNATGSPQTLMLNGTATAVFNISATPLTNTIAIGTTSATFTVSASAPTTFTTALSFSCTNTGTATCAFSPTTIKRGQTTMMTVSGLSGSTPNPLDFSLIGSSGASGTATQTVTLGLAIDFKDYSLTASPALATIAAGQSTVYTVSVAPTNGFSQAVSLSCSNLPPQTTCTFLPTSATPNGVAAATSALTVQTTATTVSSRLAPWNSNRGPREPMPPGSLAYWLLALAGFLAIAWGGRSSVTSFRSGLATRLGLGAALLFVVLLAACNQYGFNVIGPSPLRGTIPGNYSIIITGTLGTSTSSSNSSSTSAPAVTRSTSVNLSVGASASQ